MKSFFFSTVWALLAMASSNVALAADEATTVASKESLRANKGEDRHLNREDGEKVEALDLEDIVHDAIVEALEETEESERSSTSEDFDLEGMIREAIDEALEETGTDMPPEEVAELTNTIEQRIVNSFEDTGRDFTEEDAYDSTEIESLALESHFSCDCDYRSSGGLKGGCTVVKEAPKGYACYCSYKGGWTCGGEVVSCKDKNSKYCNNPDRTRQSCKQGGGDCKGYQCDCDYNSKSWFKGGCKIVSKAPPGNACKCEYKGAWTCQGKVVDCKNKWDHHCKYPSTSKSACHQAPGADCDGY